MGKKEQQMEPMEKQKQATEQQETVKAAVKAETVVAPPKPIILEDKMVTVRPKVSGRYYVAGWLTLVKGKDMQVTRDQKRSLERAGLIYL